MSFVPVIPFSGYAGWSFLQRTFESQKAAFVADPGTQRDEAYFRAHIGEVHTAEQLVADHRLLKVALGAFGLEADIGNRFFIRKVLADGTLEGSALSNKLANKQYREMAAAFGFGDFSTPRTQLSDFADEILSDYRRSSFEAAVGEVNPDLRIVLHAGHALTDIADETLSEDGKWFSVMGSPPLRSLFETAFGLPSSFGTLDIDRQLGVLKDKAQAMFGSDGVAQFADAGVRDKLTRQYLARAQIGAGTVGTVQTLTNALQLLR